MLDAAGQGVHTFRVTRNADLERHEDEAEDLLDMVSDELRERRCASRHVLSYITSVDSRGWRARGGGPAGYGVRQAAGAPVNA